MENKNQKFKLDFIGIGAVKSGTTWLVANLGQHPRIFIPKKKEVFFFCNDEHGGFFSKGLEWYEGVFAESGEGKLLGEFTTHYMYYPECAGLIKEHYPDVKIIASLRNPVDMIYSYYWWRRSNISIEAIPQTFEEALESNEEYLNRGKYFEQIKRYTDIFPKKNIKVIIFDEIVKNPHKVVTDVLDFLGLENGNQAGNAAFPVNTANKTRFPLLAAAAGMLYNVLIRLGLNEVTMELIGNPRLTGLYKRINKKKFKYPPMKNETRELLKKALKPDIEKLEELLEINLTAWKV